MSQRHEPHRPGSERGPYGSGPRRRPNGGGPRRSYEGTSQQPGGGPPAQQYDAATNVKHKIVKLGDQPDRLLAKIREAALLLDSFLTHDFRTYLSSILNEVPSPGVDAEGLAAYFKQQANLAFGGCQSRLPSADIVLQLFVDCIVQLPHKHSYYICLLWYMIHETLVGNSNSNSKVVGDEEEVVRSIQLEFTEIFHKFATVRVKGETAADEVEVVALVDKPGGYAIPVKFEVGDHRQIDYQDRALFLMVLVYRIEELLHEKIWTVLQSKDGINSVNKIYGALRGLADFTNVGLLSPASFFSLVRRFIPDSTDSSEQTLCMIRIAGTSLMWLAAGIYEKHKAEMSELISAVLDRIAAFKSTVNKEKVLARSPLDSYNAAGELPDAPFSTNLDLLAEGLRSLMERQWVPKALPRLYDSAKLKEYSRRECYIPLTLEDKTDISLNWNTFASSRLRTRYRRGQIEPVELWRSPKCELVWSVEEEVNCARTVLSEAYEKSCLEVELMRSCDIYILKIYIEQTIMEFYQDLDLCAETLLLIPCQHDQYLLVLINHIFDVFLSASPSLTGLSLVNVMDGLLLAQLLRRLSILERSFIPHINQAISALLATSETLSEFTVSRVVDFMSTWLTSNPEEVCSQVIQILERAAVAFAPLPQPANLSENISTAYKNNSILRVISLVLSRVSRLCSPRSFQSKIPANLRALVPSHDLLNTFNPTADLEFCLPHLDDPSRCRIPPDLEEMKKMTFASKPPLESLLLRDVLRLQIIGGRREQALLVKECLCILKQLVGTKLIQSLRDFTRNEQDAILFTGINANIQTKASGSLKQEGPIVKSEMGPEHDPHSTEIVDNEVEDEEEMNDEDLECEGSLLFANHQFSRFEEDTWVWDLRSVSRLLSMTIYAIGSRTFSHLEKALELYSSVIKIWKQYLVRQRLEDEDMVGEDGVNRSGESEVMAFETMLVDHAFQLCWPTNNVTKAFCTVAHLVNRDCVSLHTLVNYLCTNCILSDTIGGDEAFWDIVDLMVNNVSAMPIYTSQEITKNVMKDYKRGPQNRRPGDVKSEDQLAASAPAVVPDSMTKEEEPNIKLSQEDLSQLIEQLILHLLSRPNFVTYKRLHRLLRISNVHLNSTIFSLLIQKGSQNAAILNELLKNVENPSARTVTMVQRILDRVIALDARTKGVNPDMVAFFWCKCTSQDQAFILQQQCDEQANRLGLVVVQKLNKVKKTKPSIPEDTGSYYTQMVIGFDGLLERSRYQADFFSAYTKVVKEFVTRQGEWKLNLERMVVEKLQSLCKSQYALRDACLDLIHKLGERAYERYGLEMDHDDTLHLGTEYDQVLRRLTPNSLNLQIEMLTKFINNLKQRRPSTEKIALTQDRLNQLKKEVAKHQDIIDNRLLRKPSIGPNHTG